MRTYQKVFKDEHKLERMLHMRQDGWTFESLAIIFGVDHSSIYKACKVHKVKPSTTLISLDFSELLLLTGFIPRKEKTYKDYLEMERRRKLPKLLYYKTSV